jgi:hypothetical protein
MRETAFRNLTKKAGMSYLNKDEYGVIGYLQSFELFKGKNSGIKYLCQKKDSHIEEEINYFDFSFMIMVGKVPVVINQTVFFVNSKALDLPVFKMSPENFSSKIKKFFGIEDIDFVENPYFSDQYLLTGEHESFIRHTFDPDVLHFFSRTTGLTIEACNYYMIFYREKTLIPDEELETFFQMGMDIYELFKKEDE